MLINNNKNKTFDINYTDEFDKLNSLNNPYDYNIKHKSKEINYRVLTKFQNQYNKDYFK